MISFLLATVLSGCCPIYEYIHYDKPVSSKTYQVYVINGRNVNVPIINGITPEIQEFTLPEGITIRNFFYKEPVSKVEVPKTTIPPKVAKTPVQKSQASKLIPKKTEEKVEMVRPSTIGEKTHKFLIEYKN